MVARRECITSSGRCTGLKVMLQAEVFNLDLYILPLEGCEAALGAQWLRTLEPKD